MRGISKRPLLGSDAVAADWPLLAGVGHSWVSNWHTTRACLFPVYSS
jgi:hypothetical protein